MTLTLTYFPFRALAETARLALTIGEIPFNDKRITRDEWPDLKPHTPYGSLPVLERDDGQVLAQSDAILRYVGKLTGLYPEDPWLAAKVDEVVAYVSWDMVGELYASGRLDREAKEQARKKIAETTLPARMEILDGVLAKNGTGYAVGDSMTIADIVVYHGVWQLSAGFMDGIPTDIASKYQWMQKVAEKVALDPRVREYQKRQYGQAN